MTGRGAVLRSHRAEFAFLDVVITVIGVIDEVDRDGSRPLGVENRHGEASKQVVSDEFEPLTIESVEPRENRVVTRCSVGILARFPDRGLVDTGQDDDEPDVAGVEGTPLDTRQREW